MLFATEVRGRKLTVNKVECSAIASSGIRYFGINHIVIVEPPLQSYSSIVKNLTWPTPQPTGSGVLQMSEFLQYIQQDSGLIVVDTGVITGSGQAATFTNSYNSQGYANAIIVRGKFADPETGVFTPVSLGGVADDFSTDSLSRYLVNNTLSAGRLLNQTHQVQVSMRVITRELDSTGILRPDNL